MLVELLKEMLAELNADEEDLVEFTTELVTTCCGCAVEVLWWCSGCTEEEGEGII